jgi:CRP-like cAMP-binding protein
VFSATALETASRTNAAVRDAVMEAMTGELLARGRIQFRLGRLWSDQRVADFLLERAGVVAADGRAMTALQMSRADVADYLGVTIEPVSLALSRFQREGLVVMPDAHHFCIRRPGALASLASGDRDYRDHYAAAGSAEAQGVA